MASRTGRLESTLTDAEPGGEGLGEGGSWTQGRTCHCVWVVGSQPTTPCADHAVVATVLEPRTDPRLGAHNGYLFRRERLIREREERESARLNCGHSRDWWEETNQGEPAKKMDA